LDSSYTGSKSQEKFTGKTYRKNLQEKLTGKTYRKNLQEKLTGKTYRKELIYLIPVILSIGWIPFIGKLSCLLILINGLGLRLGKLLPINFRSSDQQVTLIEIILYKQCSL